MAGFVGLAHQMHDEGLGLEIEIEIGFHAPVMHVARHGVPHRAGGKARETHHQLAGLDAVGVDELKDRTLVGGFLAAQIEPFGVALADQLGRIAAWAGALSR